MKKRGFSLIELIIVVVIMGVVYTLVLSKIESPKKGKEKPTLSTLKSYLHKFSKNHKSVEMLCQDCCQECVIKSDGKEVAKIENFFDAPVTLYRYDFFLGAVALNRNSCFDFSVDGNGVSDQVIVLYKERVYDYTDYFLGVKEYSSLEALRDAKEKLAGIVE